MVLDKQKTLDHYLDPRTKEIILDVTTIKDRGIPYRQAMVTGHAGWYREDNEGPEPEIALKPFREDFYEPEITKMVREGDRSLFWTTNYFNPYVFDQWVSKRKRFNGEVEKPGDFSTTRYYRLGVDIDLKDKENIGIDRDRSVTYLEDRNWLEKAFKYAIEYLRDKGLSKELIKPYFSGNGCYLTLDPYVIDYNEDYETADKFCKSFDALIKQIEKEFLEDYPEAKKFVKMDPLNNQCRQWKTILSVHSTNPLVCVPLEVDNPEIDIEKARPPLSDQVYNETREWIKGIEKKEKKRKNLEDFVDLIKNQKLIEYQGEKITPESRHEKDVRTGTTTKDPTDFDLELEDIEELKENSPPCLKSILEGEKISHARAKAILTLTLRVAGFDRSKSKEIFDNYTKGRGPTSNIFKSWFDQFLKKDYNLPGCRKFNERGSGYPSLNCGEWGLCDPKEGCGDVTTPFDFILKNVNSELYKELNKERKEKSLFNWWEEKVNNGEDPNPVPRGVINYYAKERVDPPLEIRKNEDGTHPSWFRDLVLEYMNEEYNQKLTLVREEIKNNSMGGSDDKGRGT